MRTAVGLMLIFLSPSALVAQHGWRALFDGETLAGWEGDATVFQVQDSAIVAGSPDRPLPRNEFLCTQERFGDFALRLDFQLPDPVNAGVQFRSERIPGSHEVIGYQADLGEGWWGALYDESRRKKVLTRPDSAQLARALRPGEWNQYAIYANGPRIRTFINGRLMIDYVEPVDTISQTGRICVQLHSGPPGVVKYRKIQVKPLERVSHEPIATEPGPVRFRKHVLLHDFVGEGITAADIDRDGDQDLVAGHYWFEAPTWERHAYREPREFELHREWSDAFLTFAVDADEDGWVDLVEFDFPGRPAYWYRNPGPAGGEWVKRTAHPAVRSESPRMEDVDGDGRDELLFIDARDGRPVWLERPGSADTVWTVHAFGSPADERTNRGRAHGLGFDDIDGDGRNDVFTIDAWWQAPATPGAAWVEHPAALGEPAAQMYAADLDGDGDQDVVSSSAHRYGLWWHEQIPAADGSIGWVTHLIDDRVSQLHAMAVADLDGDRHVDLITGKRFFAHNGNDPGSFEPSVLLWWQGGRDEDGAPTWTPRLIDPDAGVGLHLLLEDVTGDRLQDVVTASKKGVFLFERID